MVYCIALGWVGQTIAFGGLSGLGWVGQTIAFGGLSGLGWVGQTIAFGGLSGLGWAERQTTETDRLSHPPTYFLPPVTCRSAIVFR
jgi:hypothetical protein